ncbi:MAG: type II toxin-antitoxin system ParD family antitoxin [Micropepsaceae bacterium]
MNVVLPIRWQKFLRSRIASGQYGSESEIMSAALELLEKRESQIGLLRKEIDAGRRSGKARPYDPDSIKRRGRARLAGLSK